MDTPFVLGLSAWSPAIPSLEAMLEKMIWLYHQSRHCLWGLQHDKVLAAFPSCYFINFNLLPMQFLGHGEVSLFKGKMAWRCTELSSTDCNLFCFVFVGRDLQAYLGLTSHRDLKNYERTKKMLRQTEGLQILQALLFFKSEADCLTGFRELSHSYI